MKIKMTNGEVPKKVKYCNDIYEYNKEQQDYGYFEISEILELINTKYKDYYIQDFLSGEDVKKLADQIINLQKEVNKLTAESTEWESKYYDLQEVNKELANHLISKDNLSYEDYKSRIDKALRLLRHNDIMDYRVFEENLFNILTGGDKEC